MRAETLTRATSAIKVCLVVVALSAILVASAYADNAITRIDVSNQADRVLISVQGNHSLKMVPLKSQSGAYLGFQFRCKLATKGRLVGIRAGRIHNIRYSAFRSCPPAVRIVANTAGHLNYYTDWSADRHTLIIGILKYGVSPDPQPTSKVKALVQEVGTDESVESPTAQAAVVLPRPVETAMAATTKSSIPAFAGMASWSAEPAQPTAPSVASLIKPHLEPRVARAVDLPSPKPVQMAMAPVVPAPAVVEKAAEVPKPVTTVQRIKPHLEPRVAKAVDLPSPKPVQMAMAPVVPAPAVVEKAAEVPKPVTTVQRIKPHLEPRVVKPVETAVAEPVQVASAQPVVPAFATATVTPVTKPTLVLHPKPVAVKPETVQIARLDGGSARGSYDSKHVSVNFVGADIAEVLNALSLQSGYNIVATNDVKGSVSVRLSNVTVQEALDQIAWAGGYTYTFDDGTYRVALADKVGAMKTGVVGADAADATTETVLLKFADPEMVTTVLAKTFPGVDVFDSGGPDAKGNAADKGASRGGLLVLHGSPAYVKSAAENARKMDSSVGNLWAGLKTETYKVKYVSADQLAKVIRAMVPGISITYGPAANGQPAAPWALEYAKLGTQVEKVDSGNGQANAGANDADKVKVTDPITGLSYNMAVSAKEESDARLLVLAGQPDDVNRGLELAAKLDVKSPQIKILAKITSITESGEKKLGLKWDWSDISFIEATKTHPAADYDAITVAGNAWKRQPFDFSGTLDAIITNGDGQLLASPNLLVLEGKPGVFFVGDEVTYIQRIEQTTTGANILTDTKMAGVQLKVVGTVNTDGSITLNLHPEVSTLKLTTEQGITIPTVSRRFTDHVVRVKDGETIVIGGLIRNDELTEMSKIPLLGDLPFFGQLFRHRASTKQHTEVVMFITASTVQDQ